MLFSRPQIFFQLGLDFLAGFQQRRILRCYRCMFFNLRLEMEAYLRYEKTFERIVSGCLAEDCEDGMEYNEEWEDDKYDPDEV